MDAPAEALRANLGFVAAQIVDAGLGYEEALQLFRASLAGAAVKRERGHHGRAAQALRMHPNSLTRHLAGKGAR